MPTDAATEAARDPIFNCPGEMAERLATFDWAATPLGPVAQWPASLRTTCAMMLRSRFPMILSWGEDLRMLYNDAYIPTLRGKHPQAVGSPLWVQFAEVWDAVGPMQRSVLAGGEATYFEDMPLDIDWGSGLEETYFTFCYSHVPDPEQTGGVLTLFADTTGKVVGGRRLALLNALASQSTDSRSPQAVMATSLELLGTAGPDLLCGVVYRPGGDGQLAPAGEFGDVPGDWAPSGSPRVPAAVATAWSEERVVVEASPDADSTEPTGSAGGDPALAPTARVALPIRSRDAMAAVLLVAPHPLRPLDDDHRRFLDLLRDQLSQVVALATARADEQARLDALAAIDAAKGELISSVSHEFRTPLTLLLGPLEDALAGDVAALDEPTVTAMHQGAHRLLRMVNDLLDVARLDAGGEVVDAEPTDVATVTEELLAPFRGAAARSGLSFEENVDHGIGAVETDPRLWEKILLNLVSNALKYTREGGISVELCADRRVGARDEIILRVSDTGIGIPDDDLDRVFERFHRVEGNAARSIDGTGLGLALVAEAAHVQGGSARVTSSRDEGSSFEVRLPLVQVEPVASGETGTGGRSPGAASAAAALAGELAAPLPEPFADTPAAAAADAGAPLPTYPPTGLEADAEGPVILVVDDNHAMRARLGRVLGEVGRVVVTTDGEEALAVLRRTRVDLVVTDVMMPRLDGVGLLQAIRADAALATTPVVVLSARAGAEAATGALEAGADDYVVKPFTRGELLARCRTSLELARLRAEATAGRTRSTLVAGVSHDMQTPLSVIRTVLELLSGPDVDAAMRRELTERALPRAHHLERLIRQFLDWSRLAVGTPITSYREPTDLAALVGQVVAEYPEATMAPCDEPVVASCDQPRTVQIIHNLIGNAIRVARSGVGVRLRPSDPDDAGNPQAWEVLVRDDGLGVAEHVLPHLFAPFSPSNTVDGRGSGLGLHVSREAARAQGGDLVLESTGPRGTTFVLRVLAED